MAEPDSGGLDDEAKSEPIRPAQADPMWRCEERRERFIKRHGVKRFEHRPRNLSILLQQGGAPIEEVRRVLKVYFGVHYGVFLDYCGKGNPFDHNEMWGRNGTPLYLIGHPYEVDESALGTLNAIGQLGMHVVIHAESWYGYGTVQVQVYHYPTVAKFAKEIAHE